ncbi:MAG: hypothetical protein H0V54_06640 [Chthoniobacterales bacterium]|nr:hypothetical protein [Chthoniobacterales bacterium]
MALESYLGQFIDFTVPQLNAMAGWIRTWDSYHQHPITVHPEGNSPGVYSAILSTGAAGDWLDAVSYYAHAVEDGTPGNANIPFDSAEPHQYDKGVEVLRAIFSAPPYNRRAVISVDEQGHHLLGASGRDSATPYSASSPYISYLASPAGRRRLALYDILFSGGNLEWYGGYGMLMDGFDACGNMLLAGTNHGGGDVSIEEFRSREELWAQTGVARRFLLGFPYWEAVPNDTVRIVGEKHDGPSLPPYGALWGQAQVFERVTPSGSPDQTFHLVYYPDVSAPSDLGSIDLSYTTTSTSFSFRLFRPDTGVPVTPTIYLTSTGGGTHNLASSLFPGGAGWPSMVTPDLIMIVVRL